MFRHPQGKETEWQPTDKYMIDFNERIDPSLIGRLKTELGQNFRFSFGLGKLIRAFWS